jgi:aldehyde:ferredoxin oxidoreductase
MKEPVAEGPAEGQVSRLPEMRPEYYHLRGWSDKGEPLPATLKALGLEK